MAKRTLQQRLVDALVATGRGTPVESRSRKYVTLKRPDGSFFYVGPAGALRFRQDRHRQHSSARRLQAAATRSDGTRVPDDSAENLVEELVSCGFVESA